MSSLEQVEFIVRPSTVAIGVGLHVLKRVHVHGVQMIQRNACSGVRLGGARVPRKLLVVLGERA